MSLAQRLWAVLWARMSPHVARCRCQQWRQDRLPQTFTPYDPSRWSQLSSRVHSQRISVFLASYSADSNAWSNNFNTIFWSDEPTSDASGSWLPVVLNRQHNTKQTRRSENDDTPQPLDQWTNSPFIGQQIGNWSICHALCPIRKPIVHPTLYPTHISFIPSQSSFPFLKYGY